MAIAGPRLDRPSAIGDEGRPRAASLWIASIVVLGIVGASGVAVGSTSLVMNLALVCGVTAAGIALVDRPRLAHTVAGNGLVVSFGGVMAALLVFPPVLVGTAMGIVITGYTLSMFGIAASWADVGNEAGIRNAFWATVRTIVATFLLLTVLTFCLGLLVTSIIGVEGFIGTSAPVGSLLGFLLLGTATGATLLLAIRWIPFRQLTPRSERPSIDRQIEAADQTARRLTIGAFLAFTVVFVLALTEAFEVLFEIAPPLEGAFTLLSSAVVVISLLAAIVVFTLVACGAKGIQRLAGYTSARSSELVAASIAATLYLLAVASVGLLGLLFGPAGLFFILGLLMLPFVLAGCLGLVLFAISVGICPDRAAGPALSAAGLLVASGGIAAVGGPTSFVFLCVIGAVVVWDTSAFGLGLTAELGHLPATRRMELLHGVVIGASALVVFAAVTVFDVVRLGGGAEIAAIPAALVVLVGVLVLLYPVKG